MHRLRAAETGDIEAMTDLLLRHGPNPWNHLPEEGVRAHLRAIADGCSAARNLTRICAINDAP